MTFWVQEKQQYLEHCCPIVSTGQICEQNIEHFNAFFSHNSEPNCDQHCDRFTANNFRWGQENSSKGSHPSKSWTPPPIFEQMSQNTYAICKICKFN